MKKVILGDTHGRSLWKLIVHQEQPDVVMFLGDYFDTKDDISAVEQIHNFKEIINYKISNPQIKVILLLGNHDLSYYPLNSIGLLIYHLQKRKQMISTWKSPIKYQYGVPKHLKK